MPPLPLPLPLGVIVSFQQIDTVASGLPPRPPGLAPEQIGIREATDPGRFAAGVTVSFAKRFIGAENLPTRLSEFDVQQAFSLRGRHRRSR